MKTETQNFELICGNQIIQAKKMMFNKKNIAVFLLEKLDLRDYRVLNESGIVFKKKRDADQHRFYSVIKLGWNQIQLSKMIHLEKRIPEIYNLYKTVTFPDSFQSNYTIMVTSMSLIPMQKTSII